jgi:drug/metabolite transporter (DMT)-like permease
MAENSPQRARLSPEGLILIIVSSVALAALFAFLKLGVAFVLASLAGFVGILIGVVMMGRRASIGGILAAVFVIIFSVLIFMNRITLLFDDPRILVPPLAALVIILLFVGYLTSGRRHDNAYPEPSKPKPPDDASQSTQN